MCSSDLVTIPPRLRSRSQLHVDFWLWWESTGPLPPAGTSTQSCSGPRTRPVATGPSCSLENQQKRDLFCGVEPGGVLLSRIPGTCTSSRFLASLVPIRDSDPFTSLTRMLQYCLTRHLQYLMWVRPRRSAADAAAESESESAAATSESSCERAARDPSHPWIRTLQHACTVKLAASTKF